MIEKYRKAGKLCLCLILIACISTACGDEVYDISVFELKEKMDEAMPGLPEMTVIYSTDEEAEGNLARLLELDYDLVKEYYYEYAKEGSAEEMAVLRMKDTNGVIDAKNSFSARLEQRKNMYQTYSPDEVSKLEKARIVVKGNYIAVVVSNSPDGGADAFENALK